PGEARRSRSLSVISAIEPTATVRSIVQMIAPTPEAPSLTTSWSVPAAVALIEHWSALSRATSRFCALAEAGAATEADAGAPAALRLVMLHGSLTSAAQWKATIL